MDTVEFTLGESSETQTGRESVQPMHVEFGAISHRGRVRPNNEDHYLVWRGPAGPAPLLTNLPDGFLPPSEDATYGMVVADGIGGAAFGEVASRLAVSSAWELGLGQVGARATSEPISDDDGIGRLESSFRSIHHKLLEHGESDASLLGMGTTLTAAYIAGRDLFIGHVGDSRAYLVRQGAIRCLTRDHTLRRELIDAGVIRTGSDEARAVRNVLTSRLGGLDGAVRVDTQHVELMDGDYVVLCTDGLTDLLNDAEISQILRMHVDLTDACARLVDLALQRGGRDNVTVVVARFSTPPA
jgi:protein phosphatase